MTESTSLGKVVKHLESRLVWLRMAQHHLNEQYKAGAFKIPIHLAFGHESIAVAVDAIMDQEDELVLSHRNMHYNLLRIGALRPVLDEYLMLPTGIGEGRLGSMNLSNSSVGLPYSSSILGNNLPVAAGLALSKKVSEKPGIVFVVTGDGAMEEGSFYETLQMAKTFELPLVIIVENNEWSLATQIHERRCPVHLDRMLAAFDLDYHHLEGNDATNYASILGNVRNSVAESGRSACVEVMLSTLGSTPHPTEPRIINYHAGPAKSIELNSGPIIEEGDNDPLHVLAVSLGADAVATLAFIANEKIDQEFE